MYADTIFLTCVKWSDFCAFNLTADLGEEDHFSLVKTGQRPSNTEISRGLQNIVTVVAYAEFENVIEIDRNRNVVFDFGVWTPWRSSGH